MSHGVSPLAAFHRLGDRSRLHMHARTALRPALFGAYREAERLRGDFPLLLGAAPDGSDWLGSLTERVNAAARETTRPGPADEPARRQILALEDFIRRRVREGPGGTLGALARAAARELAGDGAEPGLRDNLERACQRLDADAEIAGYGAETAFRVVRQAWRKAEHDKGHKLRRRLQRLAQRLSDLLRADDARAAEAREAGALQRAMGGAGTDVFDFQAMARVLRSAPAGTPMPAHRRRRIEAAIETLRTQRFVPGEADAGAPYDYEFGDCSAALDAFRRRLPAMRNLVRAIGIAELEIENRYDDSRHEPFFREFGEDRLGPADLQLFPSYLVRLVDPDPDERARLLALIESGLQFKIVVQVTDILGDISTIEEGLSFGRWAQHLARMALGLDQVFVLQAPDALLYRLREPLLRGFLVPQAALYSLYSGPSYLVSAAAAEARAFPCFVHDPEAGDDQAQRYSLAGNPQPESEWPKHRLEVETPAHVRETLATEFTLADFMAGDARFADCFATLSEAEAAAEADNDLVPLSAYLKLDRAARLRALPYVLVIDDDDRLQRAVVDDRVVEAAARCRKAWRSLQELGGIGNSHAAAAAAKPGAGRPQPTAAEPPAAASPPPASASAPAPAPAAAPGMSDAPPASDEPWIETIRCTTCNECTQINNRMFAYNADQRAYVADPDAGTYRELVQAAESCQVAIIHPGKPRNPDEPGLDELLKRAEPFL